MLCEWNRYTTTIFSAFFPLLHLFPLPFYYSFPSLFSFYFFSFFFLLLTSINSHSFLTEIRNIEDFFPKFSILNHAIFFPNSYFLLLLNYLQCNFFASKVIHNQFLPTYCLLSRSVHAFCCSQIIWLSSNLQTQNQFSNDNFNSWKKIHIIFHKKKKKDFFFFFL